MKIFFAALLLLVNVTAQASQFPLVLEGKTSDGKACFLTIESWEFSPEQPKQWYNLTVKARSSWQLPGNPSLELTKTFTPWSLYGKTKENYDQMALVLHTGVFDPEEAVLNYSFQSWDEERKLVQEYCRFYKK